MTVIMTVSRCNDREEITLLFIYLYCVLFTKTFKTILLDTNKLSNGKPQRKNVDGHADIYNVYTFVLQFTRVRELN